MSVRAATRRCIEEALVHDAFYRGYLANHLPMALVALDGLGASDEAIGEFARRQAAHLEPLRASRAPIAPRDAEACLGQAERFPDWAAFFATALAHEGAGAVLAQWMDRLLQGVSGGAFHGAIRVAYALESGSERELAHALGYWAASWQALGPAPQPAGELAPVDVLGRVAADGRFGGRRPAGRNIAERTAAAAADLALRAHVAALDPGRIDVDSLAAAAIRAYAGSGDFTVLHMVTGLHAARALLPFARDGRAAGTHVAFAVVAAYASAGAPVIAGWAESDPADWNALRERATRCSDEHDVKVAYTCWREWQRTGDELYRRAAHTRLAAALEETSP